MSNISYVKINLSSRELWVKYDYVSPNELKFFRCRERPPMYIRDIVVCDVENPNSYNSIAKIPLQCKNPCLAMFWVAENQTSVKIHYFSNYTTNEKDVYEGWDPIHKTSLLYGTNAKFADMDSDHFSIAEPRKHALSAPKEAGYHGAFFAWDCFGINAEVGICFDGKNAFMKCKLKNTDLYKIPNKDNTFEDKDTNQSDDDESSDKETPKISLPKEKRNAIVASSNPSDPEFITRVRLLVMKKFTITKEEAEEGKGAIYQFTVQ